MLERAPRHALWRDVRLCPPSASSTGKAGWKGFFPIIICGFIKILHGPDPALSTFPGNPVPIQDAWRPSFWFVGHHQIWAYRSDSQVELASCAWYFLLVVTATGSGYGVLEHPLSPRPQPQTADLPPAPNRCGCRETLGGLHVNVEQLWSHVCHQRRQSDTR